MSGIEEEMYWGFKISLWVGLKNVFAVEISTLIIFLAGENRPQFQPQNNYLVNSSAEEWRDS